MLYGSDLNQVPEADLTEPNPASYRPYPFGTISGNRTNGTSNYHSLQAVITQRTKSGLFFSANYTWSKFLDDQDTGGWNLIAGNEVYQNAYDPASNYGPSNFDIRQSLKGQVVYQLPFGKGRTFLNNNPVLDEAIGGWELSGTMILSTGNPFNPAMNRNNSNAQSDNSQEQFPNLIGDPTKGNGARTWGPNPTGPGTVLTWFNTAALGDPGAGHFGNMHRNSIYGPDLKTANADIHKVFPVWENVKVDVSINATNFLNHPSFGLPLAQYGNSFPWISSTSVGGRSLEYIVKLKF
jgi:hypothetical protein